MLAEILSTLFEAASSAIAGIGSGLSAVVGVFWAKATPEATEASLTSIGVISLVIAGLGIGFALFNRVWKLFRIRG